MARFIEIPHGVGNPETGGMDRGATLVNVEHIISVIPSGEYMCTVNIKGKKEIKAYRKYSTLCSQLTKRDAELFEVFPAEEISSAYDNGYMKGKEENADDAKKYLEDFIAKAVVWMESNPLIDNWRSKFRKDMKETMG